MKRLAGGLTLSFLAIASVASADPTVYPSGVTIHEEGVAEGLVLFGGQDGNIHLIDVNGTEVHTWTPPCGWQGPTQPIDNGNILTKSCSKIVELDWDSNVVWEYPQPEGVNYHHEFLRLDNGNTLLLVDRRDLIEPAISDEPVWDDYLIEVQPDGTIVWEWHSIDHFEDMDLNDAQKASIRARGGDWSHSNTAQVIPSNDLGDPRFAPGNIIISNRHTNGVFVIDRGSGAIVWTMNDMTVGQHMPHIIPHGLPGAGNLLVFDNGYASNWTVNVPNRNYSRVREIDPLTKQDIWDYDARMSGYQAWTFFASFVSNAQRLPNGNTFINSGHWGRLFEVDAAGALVWEFVSPHIAADPMRLKIRLVYRAYKVPFEWAGSRLSPDLVVSADAGAATVPAGSALSYMLHVENASSSPAANAEVEQILPSGTQFQGIVAPAGWTCETPAVGESGTLRCAASSLLGGESVDIEVAVQVNLCAAGTLASQVGATSDGDDATPADNSLQVEVIADAVDCSDASLCTTDSCDAVLQQCVNQPVVCAAIDGCHLAGQCNEGDGTCSTPVAPDGTMCSDGDTSTCGDSCLAGACAGTFVDEPAAVGNTLAAEHAAGVSTFSWSAAPGEFNVYRGSIDPMAGFDYNHQCLTGAGPISVTSMTDTDTPAPRATAYFLVTRVEQCRDSAAGTDSGGVPRDAGDTCPTAGL